MHFLSRWIPLHEYLLAAPLGTRLVRSSSPRFNSVISVAATNRIRLCCAIPKQKFKDDVLSLAFGHRYGFLKLDRRGQWCYPKYPATAVPSCEAPLLPVRVRHSQPVARRLPFDSLRPAFSLLTTGKTVEVFVENLQLM